MNEKEQQIRIELDKLIEKKKNLINQYWTIDVEDRDKLQIAYDEIVCLNGTIKAKKKQLYNTINIILKEYGETMNDYEYNDYNNARCKLFAEIHNK